MYLKSVIYACKNYLKNENNFLQEQSFTDKFYMNVFAALSSASVLAAFLATLIVLISGTFGGKVLFVKMLHNVMHLPVR